MRKLERWMVTAAVLLSMCAVGCGSLAIDDDPPIVRAANNGYQNKIAQLLKSGADPNTRGRHSTPLTLVAINDSYRSSAELLISAGADVNLVDRDGITPLYEAAVNDAPGNFALLVRHGASMSQKVPLEGLTACQSAARYHVARILRRFCT